MPETLTVHPWLAQFPPEAQPLYLMTNSPIIGGCTKVHTFKRAIFSATPAPGPGSLAGRAGTPWLAGHPMDGLPHPNEMPYANEMPPCH